MTKQTKSVLLFKIMLKRASIYPNLLKEFSTIIHRANILYNYSGQTNKLMDGPFHLTNE